jgi:hypothetical protein
MHLSSFGLILLDGSVNKPEPGLGFAEYQIAMANYGASLALKSRLSKPASTAPAACPTAPVPVEPPPLNAAPTGTSKAHIPTAPRSAASALVRKFRS